MILSHSLSVVQCVGYSGVVFGWMTIASMVGGPGQTGLLGLPLSYMPFLSLMITQIIVPQASLLGHLSGIVVGYAIYFGLFQWYSNFLFFCTLFWIFILCFFSWRSQQEEDTRVNVDFLKRIDHSGK
jgi:hypothetical protein